MVHFTIEEYNKRLDAGKPVEVQTISGNPVRILVTDRIHSDFPVVGLVKRDLEESLVSWTEEGAFSLNRPSPFDLVFKPTTHSKWVNIISNTVLATMYDSKQEAANNAESYMVQARLTWEE